MEFALDDFVTSPSWARIEKCKKADLLIVANCYDVQVPYNARKPELKQLLCAKLVEQGVLPKPAVKAADAAAAVDTAGDAPVADVKVAEVATMLAAGVEPGPVTDPLVGGGMTTEDLRIALQIKEVETRNKQLEVQAMHLRLRVLELENGAPVASTPVSPVGRSSVFAPVFDISKHIALVPPFRESEVDSYFSAFERIAAALSWPKEFWSLLLQCKLVGKAQEVCASLSIEDSLDYGRLKKTVLQAYELVPEAYRQKFRNREKTANQTYVEFVRDKSVLFDKWCQALDVKSVAEMRELILLEEFKKCLPERIVVYLNEQKVASVTKAAVLADEFLLTHKSVFYMPAAPRGSNQMPERRNRSPRPMRKSPSPAASEGRECFYCHEPGHLIAVCPALKKKGQNKTGKSPSGVGFINTASPPVRHTEPLPEPEVNAEIDPRFEPFVSHGFVSLTGEESGKVPVKILRDTAAYHSFMLSSVLPLSNETSCFSDLLVWGIKMSELNAPLHMIHLHSPRVSGRVKVAVLPRFPISGISFILGNDLAGGNVFPLPEVVTYPISVASACCPASDSADVSVPNVFPVCAITRAQARKLGETVDLSESFMATLDEGKPSVSVSPTTECDVVKCVIEPDCFPADADLSLNVTREMLISAQRNDPSLTLCLSSVVAAEEDSQLCVFFARFSGPYTVERKISDTDYVVQTPDRKRKSRICHINMLKRYFSRVGTPSSTPAAPVMSVSAAPPQYHLADDGLAERSVLMPAARLRNSEMLSNLEGFLSHLSVSARKPDVICFLLVLSEVTILVTKTPLEAEQGDGAAWGNRSVFRQFSPDEIFTAKLEAGSLSFISAVSLMLQAIEQLSNIPPMFTVPLIATVSFLTSPLSQCVDCSGTYWLPCITQGYYKLAPVFSKHLALSLLPHRPYDCTIDLLPGASLPMVSFTTSPDLNVKRWGGIFGINVRRYHLSILLPGRGGFFFVGNNAWDILSA
ncbi:hypothetical protein N1851_026936 [Merluccius polli]|uniref:CCHC-type domain-containing protein n=1 Tax=Merluccius polli TaxID=89951 RepID=A0AA47MB52_MERPO|nr:hypothetical protein N1851_026936 [Merluccius polli]